MFLAFRLGPIRNRALAPERLPHPRLEPMLLGDLLELLADMLPVLLAQRPEPSAGALVVPLPFPVVMMMSMTMMMMMPVMMMMSMAMMMVVLVVRVPVLRLVLALLPPPLPARARGREDWDGNRFDDGLDGAVAGGDRDGGLDWEVDVAGAGEVGGRVGAGGGQGGWVGVGAVEVLPAPAGDDDLEGVLTEAPVVAEKVDALLPGLARLAGPFRGGLRADLKTGEIHDLVTYRYEIWARVPL